MCSRTPSFSLQVCHYQLVLLSKPSLFRNIEPEGHKGEMPFATSSLADPRFPSPFPVFDFFGGFPRGRLLEDRVALYYFWELFFRWLSFSIQVWGWYPWIWRRNMGGRWKWLEKVVCSLIDDVPEDSIATTHLWIKLVFYVLPLLLITGPNAFSLAESDEVALPTC